MPPLLHIRRLLTLFFPVHHPPFLFRFATLHEFLPSMPPTCKHASANLFHRGEHFKTAVQGIVSFFILLPSPLQRTSTGLFFHFLRISIFSKDQVNAMLYLRAAAFIKKCILSKLVFKTIKWVIDESTHR